MFPSIQSDQARELILQCSDLTLLVDDKRRVQAVFPSAETEDVCFDGWLERPLVDLVSADSRPKVDFLFNENSLLPSVERRWRHLNFLLLNGGAIPLLVKYFGLREGKSSHHIFCCRDLRATEEIQRQFHKEIQRLETHRFNT